MKNRKIIDNFLRKVCYILKKDWKLAAAEFIDLVKEEAEILESFYGNTFYKYKDITTAHKKTFKWQQLQLSMSFQRFQIKISKNLYLFFNRLKNYYNVYDFLRNAGFMKYKSLKCLLKIRKLANDLKTFDGANIMQYETPTRKDALKFFINEATAEEVYKGIKKYFSKAITDTKRSK